MPCPSKEEVICPLARSLPLAIILVLCWTVCVGAYFAASLPPNTGRSKPWFVLSFMLYFILFISSVINWSFTFLPTFNASSYLETSVINKVRKSRSRWEQLSTFDPWTYFFLLSSFCELLITKCDKYINTTICLCLFIKLTLNYWGTNLLVWRLCGPPTMPFGHFSPHRKSFQKCGDDQAKTMKPFVLHVNTY